MVSARHPAVADMIIRELDGYPVTPCLSAASRIARRTGFAAITEWSCGRSTVDLSNQSTVAVRPSIVWDSGVAAKSIHLATTLHVRVQVLWESVGVRLRVRQLVFAEKQGRG